MSGFFFKKKLFCVVLLADFFYQSDYFEKNVIRSIVGQSLDNIAPTVGFSKVEHKYKVRPTLLFSQKLIILKISEKTLKRTKTNFHVCPIYGI